MVKSLAKNEKYRHILQKSCKNHSVTCNKSHQIVKYFGFVASFMCASIYAFVVATSSKLHDMFHLLRMNVAITYMLVREDFKLDIRPFGKMLY